MKIQFINKINTFFEKKIIYKKHWSKVKYLLDFKDQKNLIEINALKGDRIIDFYIYEYIVENINMPNGEQKTKEIYDSKRQIMACNENLEKFFKELNSKVEIKKEINYDKSNDISKDMQSAFIEALYYEIYKINEKKFLHALKKLEDFSKQHK